MYAAVLHISPLLCHKGDQYLTNTSSRFLCAKSLQRVFNHHLSKRRGKKYFLDFGKNKWFKALPLDSRKCTKCYKMSHLSHDCRSKKHDHRGSCLRALNRKLLFLALTRFVVYFPSSKEPQILPEGWRERERERARGRKKRHRNRD